MLGAGRAGPHGPAVPDKIALAVGMDGLSALLAFLASVQMLIDLALLLSLLGSDITGDKAILDVGALFRGHFR